MLRSTADRARLGWLHGAAVAHRGLHGAGAVENSPTAFARAVARGLAIECDVQLTADGQAVVFHDFTLDRLTAQSGTLRDRCAADLAAIPLNTSTDTIPTLAQLLAQVAGQVPLLIEVKSRAHWDWAAISAGVATALGAYDGPVAVMSFDPRVPGWFARHQPPTPRGLVVSEEHSKGRWGDIRRHAALWRAQAQFLAYDVRDLPSRFAAHQRARGLPIATWTVRSPELSARALAHADARIAEGAGLG